MCNFAATKLHSSYISHSPVIHHWLEQLEAFPIQTLCIPTTEKDTRSKTVLTTNLGLSMLKALEGTDSKNKQGEKHKD